MVNVKSIHSAPQAAAGYLYQARLALAECLRYAYKDSGVEVSIEKFDDVSFEKNGNPIELLQTKHHLKQAGDLTNTSVDLWKTLRIWAEQTKAEPSLPGRTRFLLFTTSKAPEGSAAHYLCPATEQRNIEKAEGKLMAAAAASRNAALEEAIAAFCGLVPEMRKALLGAIEVLDSTPLIADLEAVIEDRLHMLAPSGKLRLAREQIEGWWWPRVCAILQTTKPGTIPVLEIEQKLDDIRDSLKRDALPLDMADANPSDRDIELYDEMDFVRQLHTIGIGSFRVLYAKRDFYRASTQRSRWARQNLLFDGEVSRFEKTLIEEWEPRFAQMCDALLDNYEETAIQAAGQQLYSWVENDARFPFRNQAIRFLNVGSYHILANNLRIAWHRDYLTLHANSREGDADVY